MELWQSLAPGHAHFAQQAEQFHKKWSPVFTPLAANDRHFSQEVEALHLAKDLLVELGNVEPTKLEDLAKALSDGADGYGLCLGAS